MERIKTTVRISGRDYIITGVGSEEHIKRVAVYVDRKMEELLFTTRLPQPMVAVLTAVNIADDLLKAQDENTRLRKELLKYKMSSDRLAADQVIKETIEGTAEASAEAEDATSLTEDAPPSDGQ